MNKKAIIVIKRLLPTVYIVMLIASEAMTI